MSKYNKQNFLQQKKEEKQNRELNKKKLQMASKIFLFYRNGKKCQQLLESMILSNSQKMNAVLQSKLTMDQTLFSKLCNQLLIKYTELLKPFQLLNKKNAQTYENYIVGILQIFIGSLQLKQSSFVFKIFNNPESLINRLHFLKAILLSLILIQNKKNTAEILSHINEILVLVDNNFGINQKELFYKYFERLNSKQIAPIMSQLIELPGIQTFLHFYLERQCDDISNDLSFQYLVTAKEIRLDCTNIIKKVLLSNQIQSIIQAQLVKNQEIQNLQILYSRLITCQFQVNEWYFELVKKILLFLEEQFFRNQLWLQFKAVQDQNISQQNKLKILRKKKEYNEFLESINISQLIKIALSYEGENIQTMCIFMHDISLLGAQKHKEIKFQQLYQQVSKFDYSFKFYFLKFSLDNNLYIPFEFLAVYCNYKMQELQLMDDQEFKNTYLATEKDKQELDQIFGFIVKYARNFIGNIQNEKLPKQIVQYIKELYERNEVLKFSQWKYDNTKLNPSLPFLTEFSYRIDEFNKYLENDKLKYSRNLQDLFTINEDGEPVIKESRLILIRRGEEFSYAMHYFMDKQLKNLYHIKFENQYGVLEDGIDGGGVTKEFLTRFVNQVFDPNFGLFIETQERTIIPNPAFILDKEELNKYEFVGKMIGKAIYEGILIEKVLSSVFLNQVLDISNTVHDFRYYDSAQYQTVFNLKNQDVTDFGLTFSVTENHYGQVVEFDLISNGRKIAVTNDNKLQYIQLYSDFKLNKQIKLQSQYFRNGLQQVIDSEKLKLFTNQELQLLISGQPVINLQDLQSNTHYKGYSPNDQTIRDFWDVLDDMEYSQQSQFLFFFSSCSRAPTQGFKSLDPPFQIQKIPILTNQDKQRLPTSATCFNILKLPDYKNKALLREKLLKAITSNTGLELS